MSRAGLGTCPGASFGTAPLPPCAPERGMGLAVARRTVFRAQDQQDWGRVADRVAAGNLSLLGGRADAPAAEGARLRNAIATGALPTSGRHLQHGDPGQAGRNIELFTNCATAITSFAEFYLLLNGSGVGRAHDDELVAVDWAQAPALLLHLSPSHPDFPRDAPGFTRFARDFGIAPMEERRIRAARRAWPRRTGATPARCASCGWPQKAGSGPPTIR